MAYGKIENGTIVYATIKNGALVVDGKMVWSNDYSAYGYYPIKNVNEVGTDHIEDGTLMHYVGVERTLAMAIEEKVAEIDAYDTSDAVNGFEYNGQTIWIDKATRVGLVNAIECTMTMGEENITFGIQDLSVTLPCSVAMKMMAALEVYALGCYNVTLAHKNAVRSMESIADVDAFDVSADYPNKLVFEP